MKIVMICQPADRLSRDGDDRSSVAILTRRFAHRLARRHEVTLLARREPGQPEAETDAGGARIRRVRVPERCWHETLLRLSGVAAPDPPYFASEAYYRGYFRRVAQRLRAESPDVVHFHNLAQHAALLRAAVPNAKLVLQMDGDSLVKIPREVLEEQLRPVDVVMGISAFVTKGIAKHCPELADRLATIHLGVDLERFHPDGDVAHAATSKQLLYVGRISPEKGIHVLLEAFERVLESHPEAELELIGAEGQLPFAFLAAASDERPPASLARHYGRTRFERLRRQIFQRSGYLRGLLRRMSPAAARRVRWRGTIPEAALCDAYRRADVFVFPSLWNEAFGMPVVEAMASGIPAVVTRSGPLAELVGEGACGRVVERDDPAGLAAAIAGLFDDPALARRLGAAGRRRAESHFSWDDLASQLERLYARPAGEESASSAV